MTEAPAVLIVDDNPSNRRLYAAVLKDSGAEIVSAENAEQALAHCEARRFAMILLDVHLSGSSGFDLARQLHEAYGVALAPILFVSAVYVHEADAFRGYSLGAVDYILSPVVPEVLRSKVSVFIRLHRLRDEAQAQNQAIQTAYRELRSAYAELERFSWSVSHDLRTPLAQIIGLVAMLQTELGPQLAGKGAEYLALMSQISQRMSRLIDDLLSLALVARAELVVEPVDLSALAQALSIELTQTEPQRMVEWRLMPGIAAQGDACLLRTVLTNLMGNALKYSQGQAAPQIEFGQLPSTHGPTFFVRDNGAGFDAKAVADRLFKPFQRFHPDASFKGTGVGLAIAQCAVIKHGGTLWAESSPGHGASFFFTLPRAGRSAQPLGVQQ